MIFDNFQRLKKKNNVDILAKRPDVKRYLMLSPILWPYYFITEQSPLERFSEFFFKYYGDKGHSYMKTQGLKNFLNDVLKGKGRYKNCQVNYICWPIDQNSPAWCKEFGKRPMHAHIIYTQMNGKYLLGITLMGKGNDDDNGLVSRFQLDQCQRLCKSEFKMQLERIDPIQAKEFITHIK
jgi:hypothetical protein